MSSFINGPINYIQLNGSINNIQKNITIFLDLHLDINNQTRCDSFDSIDISQYLYKLIKNITVPLDFFLEIREEQLYQPITNKRDIYIAEVIEMFKSEFIIEQDKIKYSKSNPNVRLHYLDIRDHLKFLYVINQLNIKIFPILKSLKNENISYDDKINKLEQLKQYIENIKKYIIDVIDNKINIQQTKLINYDKKSQDYYLNKIIHIYKHKSVKSSINKFLNIFVLNYFTEFIKLIMDFNQSIINYKLNITNDSHLIKLFDLYSKLYDNILLLYGTITDVYFLRRFLDKDYIQNTITYCGRNHALNYIYFLVKYYNFTITNIYNTGGLTINDIIYKIKETDDLDKIHNLFLFEGEKPKQCVTKPRSEFYNLGW